MISSSTNESISNKEASWVPTIASIGLSTIGGAIIGGIPGGLVGLSAGVADEYLIHENHQTQHNFSSTAFWSSSVTYPLLSACASFFPATSLPLYSVASLVVGVAASYFTDDFFDFKEKLGIPLESFCSLNRFFDERNILSKKELEKIHSTFKKAPSKALELIIEDAKELYQNEFLMMFLKTQSLTLLDVVLSRYFLTCLAGYGNNLFISAWTQSNHSSLSKGFSGALWEGASIVGLLASKQAVEFAISAKQTSIALDLYDCVLDKSLDVLIEKNNGRKVLAAEKGKELIPFLTHDLLSLLYNGAYPLTSSLTGIFDFLSSLRDIMSLAPDAFFSYMLTIAPLQKGMKKLSEKSKVIAETYSKNQTKLWTAMGDITENIEQINLRDGDEFIKKKYKSLASTDAKLIKEKELVNQVLDQIKQFNSILHNVSDMLFLGFKVVNEQLSPAQLPLFKRSMDKVCSFLSSRLQFQVQNQNLELSKSRINRFFEIIEAQNTSTKVVRTTNSQDKIIFKNYALSLEGEEIIKIDHFEFDAGKHYAITGKSGCGKTSTLIDLKVGLEGSLTSQGEISIYSKNDQQAQMMFLDQELYLPTNSSLLESIYFPKVLGELSKEEASAFKKRVISLFEELEMEPFVEVASSESTLISNLESPDFKLSGGQRKKIGIIQAILACPDVLIMDETFTGLDPRSLIKCQAALNNYLPGTLILSVDHHAEDNNFDGFYHSEVNFSEGTADEMQLPSKSLPTA